MSNTANDIRKRFDAFQSSTNETQLETRFDGTNFSKIKDYLPIIFFLFCMFAILFLYFAFDFYNKRRYHPYSQYGFYALVCFCVLDLFVCVGFLFIDKTIQSIVLYMLLFLYFVACTVLVFLGYQQSKILASLVPETNQRLDYWEVQKFLTDSEQQKKYNDAISYTDKIIMGLIAIIWIPLLIAGGGRAYY
jgi:ABC-type transport system involved in multi-copper enzyme maturation permease subunit